MEIGRQGDPVVSMGSLSGGGRAGIGRRFGSGLITMWDGMPPCDTMVGGGPDVGKGTRCASPWKLDVQGGNVPEAKSLHIQWMARRRVRAPPSS